MADPEFVYFWKHFGSFIFGRTAITVLLGHACSKRLDMVALLYETFQLCTKI
jgi:hypothetical protein